MPINDKDKKIIDNLRKSMPKAEAGPQGYYALNKDTYAIGMYQMVPYHQLDKMKKFAKETDGIYIDPSKIPSYKEFEAIRSKGEPAVRELFKDILSNKSFQEAYFEKYMVDEVLDKAKNYYDKYGESTGWPIEGFASLIHLQGVSGAKETLNKSLKNPEILDAVISKENPVSPNAYVERHTQAIVDSGGELSTGDIEKDNAKSNKTLNELVSRYDKIFNSKVSEQQKQLALENLYKDVKGSGLGDQFNQYLNDLNIKEQEEYEKFRKGETPGGFLNNVFQDPTQYLSNVEKDGSFNLRIKDYDKIPDINKEENDRKRKEINAKYDEIIAGIPRNRSTNGKRASIEKQRKAELDKIDAKTTPEERLKAFLGTKEGAQFEIKREKSSRNSQDYITIKGDTKQFLTRIDNEYVNITGENLYFDLDVVPENDGTVTGDSGYTRTIKENFKNIAPPKIVPNRHYEPDFEKITTKEEDAKNSGIKPTSKDEKGNSDTSSKETSKTSTDEAKQPKLTGFDKRAEDFFGSFIDKEELIVPDTFEYNKDDYNKQLPIGAMAQAGLALMGLSDAETELPLRNEQVSEAIINYAKTNKKLSEIGLRPEEEAAMKSDVADIYQEGMSRLTRASGGNRNLVLGNAGTLNRNRLQGILNISLADIQRKDAAFERYGQTLQYIENFNTNRDIANHGIKLQEAQQKREAGAQLAASGFAGMIEELQYQKENGPGSANHMMRQQLMYSTFGVVPGMKDDGTGTKPGTVSYAKAQKENILQANEKIKEENAFNERFKSRVRSLSDIEKQELEKSGFFDKVQDPETRKNWTETGFLNLDQAGPKPAPYSDNQPIEETNNEPNYLTRPGGFLSY